MKMTNGTFIVGAATVVGVLAGIGSNGWLGAAAGVTLLTLLLVLDAIREQMLAAAMTNLTASAPKR